LFFSYHLAGSDMKTLQIRFTLTGSEADVSKLSLKCYT